MTALALLWLLAGFDAACAGFRAYAGRDARIDKRRYFARAMLEGAAAGQAPIALVALASALAYAAAPDRAALWDAYQRAAWAALGVYLPYAALIFAAFGVRALPPVDLRSMSNVVIFGPFTFIRPAVAAAGVAAAVAAAPRWEVAVLGALAAGSMLLLSRVLDVRCGRTLGDRGVPALFR